MSGDSTFYADARQLAAWFEGAQPGASAIYATGPCLDPAAEVAAMVRGWVADGAAISLQERRDGRLTYRVRRVCAQAGAAGKSALRSASVAGGELDETPEGKLLAHLARLANLGLPCPTNAELARATGLRDADAAKYRFRQLQARRLITVTSTPECRVVTVVATGARTADLLPYEVKA